MQCFCTRDTPFVSSSRTSSSSLVSSNHVFITMEDINAENCQRPHCTPLDLQFEVLSTDVNVAGSMMEGMTNVQALSPSISSFASLNTPAPSEFTTAIPYFASRSAGPQGDNISVLLGAQTFCPAYPVGVCLMVPVEVQILVPQCVMLSQVIWLVVFRQGFLEGGWNELYNHPKMHIVGKYKCYRMELGDAFCQGFVSLTRGLICANKIAKS